jgi:hypothetical protein
MSRIVPCVQENEKNADDSPSQNCTLGSQNCNSGSQNCTLGSQNCTLGSQNCTSSVKCEFCLNTFCNKFSKNRHQETCKLKDDPVRVLEIETKVNPKESKSKNECRFCNKEFCRKSVLYSHYSICPDRREYHDQLKEVKNVQIINNNIDNSIDNSMTFNGQVNIINLIGNEDTSHIDIYKIIDKLRRLNCEYGDKHLYLQAGEMVINYDELLREVPQNRNVYLPNEKSIYAEVKTESGWEKMERDQTLNETFKNSAKLLYDTKETIDNTNKKVFTTRGTKEVFNEINHFSKKGFKHENSSTGEIHQGEQKMIQKKYRIGKLKNKITDCPF